ncbi:hypothetical protein IKQ21_09455 [bacterium]|nr:hypothetical protein [bacterium]
MTNIKFKRGNKAKLPSLAPDGMPLWCSDTKELYIGTGNGVSQVTGGGSADTSDCQKLSEKNVPNGYVGLDSNGMIPKSYYDNVNVGLSTFLTSNATSAPSNSWKALGTTVYKSSYSDFYNDANSRYSSGSNYSINYSNYLLSSYTNCFVADLLDDSLEFNFTDDYHCTLETALYNVTMSSTSMSLRSNGVTILRRFVGNWTSSLNSNPSHMTISGTITIELVLKSQFINLLNIKRFSRYISNTGSGSSSNATLSYSAYTTQDGSNWTLAKSGSSTAWDLVVSGTFKGIKLTMTTTGSAYGNYTHDKTDTASICRSNRYYLKSTTMQIEPVQTTTILNNKIKQKDGFLFTKDYTYNISQSTSSDNMPTSNDVINSNWILAGCYDFSTLFNKVFKINTSSQTVILPSSASFNYVCVENSNLNIIDFYQTVLNTYMKKNYENAEKPYVVYCSSSAIMFSNGFCIQKGNIYKPSAAGSYTYTYPIAYNSYIFPMLTYYDSRTSNLYWPHLTSYDTTGFTYYFNTYNANASSYIVWMVYGYVSSSTLATYKAKNSFT